MHDFPRTRVQIFEINDPTANPRPWHIMILGVEGFGRLITVPNKAVAELFSYALGNVPHEVTKRILRETE